MYISTILNIKQFILINLKYIYIFESLTMTRPHAMKYNIKLLHIPDIRISVFIGTNTDAKNITCEHVLLRGQLFQI